MVHVYWPLNGCHFFRCTDWIYDGFFLLPIFMCRCLFFFLLSTASKSVILITNTHYTSADIYKRERYQGAYHICLTLFSPQWLGRHPKTSTFRDRFIFDTSLPFVFRVRISLLIECFSWNYIIRCNLWFVDYSMLANTKIFISSLCIVFNCVLLLAPDPFWWALTPIKKPTTITP